MAFKKQAISFIVSQIGFVERGVIKVKLNFFHFAPVLCKNDSLHTCADVENNRSFQMVWSTFHYLHSFDLYVRDIRLNKIFFAFALESTVIWHLKSNRFHSNTSQISFAEQRVI